MIRSPAALGVYDAFKGCVRPNGGHPVLKWSGHDGGVFRGTNEVIEWESVGR